MQRFSLAVLAALVLTACPGGPPSPPTLPPEVPPPAEDTGGLGMRLLLQPAEEGAGAQGGLATVRRALRVSGQALPADTYLCVCPPPAEGDVTLTRFCQCQVEGAEPLPEVCGDGIWNTAVENCEPGVAHSCPPGYHCNAGGEPAHDGTVYPACFNCILDAVDAGSGG